MRNNFSYFRSTFSAKFFVLFLLTSHLSYLNSYSQTSTSSPYSRYGLGDLQNYGFANIAAMGGISQAYQNDTNPVFFINANNPASHSSYRLTAFDVGIMDQANQMNTSDSKYFANRAALSYIAFAFPVNKWWGSSIGILPFSNVGYNISTYAKDTANGNTYYQYEGSGGLNEIYWGNGFKYKNFSAGINVSYLFGALSLVSRDSFPDLGNAFST